MSTEVEISRAFERAGIRATLLAEGPQGRSQLKLVVKKLVQAGCRMQRPSEDIERPLALLVFKDDEAFIEALKKDDDVLRLKAILEKAPFIARNASQFKPIDLIEPAIELYVCGVRPPELA